MLIKNNMYGISPLTSLAFIPFFFKNSPSYKASKNNVINKIYMSISIEYRILNKNIKDLDRISVYKK